MASPLALASCGDDGAEAAVDNPASGPASVVTLTDEMQCKQLGGGWTYHYSRTGGGMVPPGDGAPTSESGKVVAGFEANLPADVLDASRVEREASGWGEVDIMYLDVLSAPDPLSAAQRFETMAGGEFAEMTDAAHAANIERLGKQLNDAPTC